MMRCFFAYALVQDLNEAKRSQYVTFKRRNRQMSRSKERIQYELGANYQLLLLLRSHALCESKCYLSSCSSLQLAPSFKCSVRVLRKICSNHNLLLKIYSKSYNFDNLVHNVCTTHWGVHIFIFLSVVSFTDQELLKISNQVVFETK